MMRRKGFGLAAATASVIAVLSVGTGGDTAAAAPTRHAVAGGLVKVKVGHDTATNLSITELSPRTSTFPEHGCLTPLKGQTEIDFGVDYHSFSVNAPVPGIRLSMQSAGHDRFGIALLNGRCRQVSNYHFTAATASSQEPRHVAVFLRKSDPLGALRISIDGHHVRLKLRKGCVPFDPSESPTCSPFPVVRVKR